MAKFLSTRKAVSELEELIRNADQTLILVSPYLKISRDFKELLDYRNKKDKITTIIFGKQELNPDEMKFLQGLRFVILKYNETLHAKCYLNDSKMIITSLNLFEFSMANNKEMGVLLNKEDVQDLEVFNEAYKEVLLSTRPAKGLNLEVSLRKSKRLFETKLEQVRELVFV